MVLYLYLLSKLQLVIISNWRLSLHLELAGTRQEAIEKRVYIEDYLITNIAIQNSSYIFPFEAVWLERPWSWKLKHFFFKEPQIDSLREPRLIFEVKAKSEFYERNWGISWLMKKCEEKREYNVGLMMCIALITL